jgi:hypothetical protein
MVPHFQMLRIFGFQLSRTIWHFVVNSNAILDSSNMRLIWYVGSKSHVLIPRQVQILGSECLSYRNSLSPISFETNSELTRIRSKAFYCCSPFKSITIPCHVQILCVSCFTYWKSHWSISCETNSKLTCIQTEASAAKLLLSAVVTANISFIAGDAFRWHYYVSLAGAGSDSEFSEWNQCHQSRANGDWSQGLEKSELEASGRSGEMVGGGKTRHLVRENWDCWKTIRWDWTVYVCICGHWPVGCCVGSRTWWVWRALGEWLGDGFWEQARYGVFLGHLEWPADVAIATLSEALILSSESWQAESIESGLGLI